VPDTPKDGIDFRTEEVLSLAQAARRLPRRSTGKHVSAVSVWRWCKYGCKGRVLRHSRLPDGTYITSAEALTEFLAAPEVTPPPSTGARPLSFEARQQRASELLKQAGFKHY
jgi:hypothetical protein